MKTQVFGLKEDDEEDLEDKKEENEFQELLRRMRNIIFKHPYELIPNFDERVQKPESKSKDGEAPKDRNASVSMKTWMPLRASIAMKMLRSPLSNILRPAQLG